MSDQEIRNHLDRIYKALCCETGEGAVQRIFDLRTAEHELEAVTRERDLAQAEVVRLRQERGSSASGMEDQSGKPLTFQPSVRLEEKPGLGIQPARIAMQRAAGRMRNIARSMLEMLDQSLWGDAVADLEWHAEQLDPVEDADAGTGTADDQIDPAVVDAIRKHVEPPTMQSIMDDIRRLTKQATARKAGRV